LEQSVQPRLAQSPSFLIPKGMEKKVDYTVSLPDAVAAPIVAGQKLGTVTYTLEGKTIGSINLVAGKEVAKVTFGHLFFHFIQYFFAV
jgi:D-alanyl-D-alanine carboxypeptidase (penicillin-binding protein 5/6)